MKFDTTKSLEILGVATVVVSLLFVAFELQQSNRIAIGTTEYELLRDGNELNKLRLTDPNVRALLIKVRSNETELTSDERFQAVAYVFTQYSYWLAVVAAHSQGLVSDSFMDGMLVDIEQNVQFEAGLSFAWQIILERGYETNSVLEAVEKALSST